MKNLSLFIFITRIFKLQDGIQYYSEFVFFTFSAFMFSLLMEWMGAEEKMVGLKKYEMWWGSC